MLHPCVDAAKRRRAARRPTDMHTPDRHDPEHAPRPRGLDEQQRIQLVEDLHHRAAVELPNAKPLAAVHVVAESPIAMTLESAPCAPAQIRPA
jgi:hypothetical protein